jgi:hypothetical protein
VIFLAEDGSCLSKNANFFDNFFGDNIFKIITSVPVQFPRGLCSRAYCFTLFL